METRANYLLVGGFVLALIVGLVVFVAWFSKFQFDRKFDRYDIAFDGSVTGLDLGSSVRYSGVRVGEVVAIDLDPEMPDRVSVVIEVDAGTPVRVSTVASLELEGLTGGLYVLLSGGTSVDPLLPPSTADQPSIIASRASSLEQVIAGAPAVLESANLLLARANRLLNDDNRARIGEILDNTSRLTGALAEQEELIDNLFKDAAGTMANLRDASDAVRSLAATVEAESKPLASQATSTLATIEDVASSLDESMRAAGTDVDRLTNEVNAAAGAVQDMAGEARAILRENREQIRDFTTSGLYELTTLLTEARDLLVGLNRVTTEVERDPARFLFGNQQQGYEANQ